LGVRFADRAGKGLRTAPRDALLADSVGERQRGLAFGFHRAGDTAGAVVGLMAALGILLYTQGDEKLLNRDAFQTIVLLSMIPAILAVIVLALGARDVKVNSSQIASPRFTLKDLDKRFRFFLIIVIIFTLGNSSDAFLILRAQNAGLSVVGILGMLITFNLVYAIVSVPAGALSDRIGRKRLLFAGWLFYGLVYLGFAFAGAGWQAWILMGAYGLYYGMTEGVAKALVADLVGSERRGIAYGAYNAAVGVTAFPASLMAGLLWQGIGSWAGFGPSAPFIFSAVLALIATGLLFFMSLPSFHGSEG
jgi:MFS family permease